jgi:anti-sigma regulatory factor (Ser/Thr protein kinase)
MKQINKQLKVKAELEKLDTVIGFLEEQLEQAGCPLNIATQISISVEEIFVNIANYSYPESGGNCVLDLSVSDSVMTLCIADTGAPFNPLAKEDPDITLSADERQIGGLGIWMVKQSMDRVEYCYEENQNKLTLVKSWE